jgi:uncharacterized protein
MTAAPKAASPVLSRTPGLATNYEGCSPGVLDRVLPFIEYLEVTPDSIAEIQDDRPFLNRDALVELEEASRSVGIIVHGVGLSIGSAEGWNSTYLDLLDQLFERLPILWHSEHLAYTTVGGDHLGTMLALPRTDEALLLVSERVQLIQERYSVPFLCENVVRILPEYPASYSEAGFLNELVRRTGCGLLLDVYNLECDAHNHGFDVAGFLDELDLGAVREVHVECGAEHRGYLLDVHSRVTRESTVDLARDVLVRARGSVQAVTYELLREALPVLGIDTLVSELERLRGAFRLD